MNTIERPEAILRRSLHHEVVEKLRELILAGDLEPRSRIDEAALCERFGISRTPLREAIKLLAADGLLDLLPNRGARVAALSESEIEEIVQVVGVLEALAGELACQRITETELSAIETANLEMVEAWKAKDYSRYFERNREIHEAIMESSRNSALQTVYRSLSGRVQRARFSAHKTEEQWKRAIDDHNLMVILLKRRDGAALSQLMRDHASNMKVFISAAYSGLENPVHGTTQRSVAAAT